jgi:hypothetical protein
MAKREHTVAAKEVAAVKYRAKVEAERQVLYSLSSTFLFACYPCIDCMPFATSSLKTIRKRTAKVAMLRKRWNQLRKQANKNLKHEKVRRWELEHQLSMMVVFFRLLLVLYLSFSLILSREH